MSLFRRPLAVVPDEPKLGGRGLIVDRTDEELMTLARAGSQAAFAQLANRYLPRVTNYCIKVTGDARAGDELAQETFLQLWAHRQRYATTSGFAVYLFTIARNRCRNHGRSWRRRRPFEQDDAAPDVDRATADPSQLDALLERERQRDVRAALLRLPDKLREVVILRFDQGLAYPDIAAVIGRPEATVRSRVFLGIRRLRELLKDQKGPIS
jgi:RNA polymerase sigma-70 factor (ECF subfamily)